MEIILYDYWRSSAAYRLRIALNLANLAYSSRSVDLLKGEHKEPAYLAKNPQGLVPALEIDGQLLTQSLAIIEYLDEAGFHGFLPKAILPRAQVRALSYAIAMDIHPICNSSVAKFACEGLTREKAETKDWMRHFIPKGLAAIEQLLDPLGSCCCGDSVTMADICLIPQIYNARRWGVDLQNLPRIQRIVAHLETLSAFQLAHPDKAKPLT